MSRESVIVGVVCFFAILMYSLNFKKSWARYTEWSRSPDRFWLHMVSMVFFSAGIVISLYDREFVVTCGAAVLTALSASMAIRAFKMRKTAAMLVANEE